LPARDVQAGMLACPHCGAGVAETASRCEHCSSELLLKACPCCFRRVFAGHKHCPQCGGELDVAAVGEDRPDLPCPRCETHLRARLVGDVVIDECPHCLGLFLDQVAIRRVIEDRAQARADMLLGALPKHEIHANVRAGERMYIKCPCCHVVMNRQLFATGAGVVVDVCHAHGTFFDAGELPAIIEFVMAGGLAAAARKDLERQRQEVENARTAALATSSSYADVSSAQLTRASAFVDLLSMLLGR
jgi:Zn-finger nucleic acid-binding protein